MSAMAALGTIAAVGLAQVGTAAAETAPWIALGAGLLVLAGRWYLGRQGRRTPLLPLPPEVGDDTLVMLDAPEADRG